MRDHKYDLEKQQALRTVRHLLQISHNTGYSLVPVGVVRAVVALAENGEDKLRYVALETLAELGQLLCIEQVEDEADLESRKSCGTSIC